MAIVTKLQRKTLTHYSRHKQTDCTYSIVSDEQWGQMLQIDTYGSKSRKIQGKESQTIRFSPEAIKQLRKILSEEL
ncbi:MAG TPA: hypothetical protein VEF03_00705 [Candidatus Binataceae bacterium]|nr:hypothetical protein [Candidatus Binataceae bacterium]